MHVARITEHEYLNECKDLKNVLVNIVFDLLAIEFSYNITVII